MKNVKLLALSTAIVGVLMAETGMSAETNPPADHAMDASVPMTGSITHNLTGNVGATSNYIWRGQTQTSGDAAVQGGVDYSNSGLYVGIWTSNSTLGTPTTSPETDFYVGYKGTAGSLGYDVNVTAYKYLQTATGNNIDWNELNANFSIGAITYGLGYTSSYGNADSTGTYLQAGYGMTVGKESSLTFHVGNYGFDNNAAALIDDYVDYSVTLANGAWSFMFSDTDLNAATYRDGDPVFVVSWETTVEL